MRPLSHLQESVSRLSAARNLLLDCPHDVIVAELDRWAASLQEDPAGVARTELQRHGGEVERAAIHLAETCRAPALRALIQEQLGREDALNGRKPRSTGGYRITRGFPLVAFFPAAGALLSSWPLCLQAILLRSAMFVRSAADREDGTHLLVRTLREVAPPLADLIHVQHWPSDDEEVTAAVCEAASVVVAHGSNETMRRIRDSVPGSKLFLPFGSRMSIGIVLRDAPLRQSAVDFARDILIYDQAGCLSPQCIFVQGDDSRARDFSAELGSALESGSQRGAHRRAEVVGAVRRARALCAMEQGGLVLGPPDGSWSVLYSRKPNIGPSPSGCTIRVLSYSSREELAVLLEPFRPVLQACGVAGSHLDRMALFLADLGFTRITSAGKMQMPGLGWDHDGVRLLAALSETVDIDC